MPLVVFETCLKQNAWTDRISPASSSRNASWPADIVEVLVGLVQLLHGLHVRSLREKLKCHIWGALFKSSPNTWINRNKHLKFSTISSPVTLIIVTTNITQLTSNLFQKFGQQHYSISTWSKIHNQLLVQFCPRQSYVLSTLFACFLIQLLINLINLILYLWNKRKF